jgi:diguanylate cyclase (GGDEF)-like protein
MGLAAALTVAGLGVLVGVVSLVASGRRARRADERVRIVVTELTDRTESMLADLDAALAETRAEAERSRAFGELAGSLDLEAVLDGTLEAAASLPGVDAALLTVTVDGDLVVRGLGLSADETVRRPMPGPPDGRSARAVAVSYHYAEDEHDAGSPFIYGGISVPVPVDRGEPASLAIFTRSASHQFPERHVLDLEQLATRAGPAIANAVRFQAARDHANLDPLTKLGTSRLFQETLEREVARARRYGRRVTVVVFDLDDFDDVDQRLGRSAAERVLADVGGRLRATVRSADAPCRVGADEFAVVMPESGLEEGVRLAERLRSSVASAYLTETGTLGISAGVAELEPDDDARSLLEQAGRALSRAKTEGKGRVVFARTA